jgi:quercetin dioxygenase-like cupin family protein
MKTVGRKKKPASTRVSVKAIPLAAAIGYRRGAIVSKTLLDRKAGSLTLFAFDAGQGLSEHSAPCDAAVQILDGEARLTIGGTTVTLGAGEMAVMPADVPHAVYAPMRFKMLLTLIDAARA